MLLSTVVLNGTPANDTLEGGVGDYLQGANGDDVFIADDGQADTLIGGDGWDYATLNWTDPMVHGSRDNNDGLSEIEAT